MTEYLSKQQIFDADDLPGEDVAVPEWGGTVRVRGMNGVERDRFEMKAALAKDRPDEANLRAEFVGRCIIDGDGKRLFTDKEIGKLGDKSAAVLDRVFDKVRELSGLGDDAIKKAAADFGSAPDDGSDSG